MYLSDFYRVYNFSFDMFIPENEEHSNVGESDVGSATQVKPQQIEVKARPGKLCVI